MNANLYFSINTDNMQSLKHMKYIKFKIINFKSNYFYTVKCKATHFGFMLHVYKISLIFFFLFFYYSFLSLTTKYLALNAVLLR